MRNLIYRNFMTAPRPVVSILAIQLASPLHLARPVENVKRRGGGLAANASNNDNNLRDAMGICSFGARARHSAILSIRQARAGGGSLRYAEQQVQMDGWEQDLSLICHWTSAQVTGHRTYGHRFSYHHHTHKHISGQPRTAATP